MWKTLVFSLGKRCVRKRALKNRRLWTTRYPRIRYPRRKGYISKNINYQLTHDGTENLKRPVKSKKLEPVINDLPTNKSLGPYGFAGEFYQHWEKNSYQSFSNSAKNLKTHFTRQVLPWYQSLSKSLREYYGLISPMNVEAANPLRNT